MWKRSPTFYKKFLIASSFFCIVSALALVLDPVCAVKDDGCKESGKVCSLMPCKEEYLKEVHIHYWPHVPEVAHQLAYPSYLVFWLFHEHLPWF